MEYLMTYGWAILIVIIVAAALYALGIFNPATYTGRIPTGFTTLGAPTDWDLASDGSFSIIMKNNLASQIEVYMVNLTMGTNTAGWDTYDYNGGGTYLQIGPGSTYSALPATTGLDLGTPTSGTSYSVDVSILYNSGGFNHTETGTVTGTVT